MVDTASPLAPRPDHVPPELVFDFDLFDIPGADYDVQLAMRAYQQRCDSLFWTPRNGGHWVAMRAADLRVMQRDYAVFSNSSYLIPRKPPDMPKELPLECDPPRHTMLRRPLTSGLMPRVVKRLEQGIRSLAIELIENVYAKGSCEFVGDIAQALPIAVFLDLVELPREDRAALRPISEQVVHGQTQAEREEGYRKVYEYLRPHILERRASPRDDLLSAVVNVQDGDRRISEADAFSYASLVLFGGLDTVASLLGFVARYLIRDERIRRELIANLNDEDYLRTASEELLRRNGVASTARLVMRDTELNGLKLKEGDMVLTLHQMAGLDERMIPDPLTLDLRRSPIGTHTIFSSGPHSCPGSMLARRELTIFLQEWLKRIPDYEIVPGTKPKTATAPVCCLTEMYLRWQPTVT